MDNKRKLRKIYIVGLAFLFGVFIITGCNNNGSRRPLDAEKVTYEQRLEHAVKNDSFEDIGFTTFTYKEGTEGWEKRDAEYNVNVGYCTGQNGEVLSLLDLSYVAK